MKTKRQAQHTQVPYLAGELLLDSALGGVCSAGISRERGETMGTEDFLILKPTLPPTPTPARPRPSRASPAMAVVMVVVLLLLLVVGSGKWWRLLSSSERNTEKVFLSAVIPRLRFICRLFVWRGNRAEIPSGNYKFYITSSSSLSFTALYTF